METKTYTILATTPKLGKKDETVTLTPKAAKYWLMAGVIAESEAKAAAKKGK